VQIEDVHADLPKVDGQVEIFLVAREAVEEKDGGATISPGGTIEPTQEATSLRRDESGFEAEPCHGQTIKVR
jgi:hypothetical protein